MTKKTFYAELMHERLPVPREVVQKWARQGLAVESDELGNALLDAVRFAHREGLITNSTAARVRIDRGRPTQVDGRNTASDDSRSWSRRR